MIITEDIVQKAICLTNLSAKAIFNTEGTTWGPKWVEGHVKAPGLSRVVPFILGEKTEWNPDWGEERDFSSIAFKELQAASRNSDDTSIIVAVCPWVLMDDEYLYPGGVSRFQISAATSAAKGRTDEALADILVTIIIMLAHLETDARVEEKRMQI